MAKNKFDIQGMTCTSCSSHVERAVKKLEGIQNVTVNLLSNNMIVEYDETVLDDDKIIKAVVDAGYGASLQECYTAQAKDDMGSDNNQNINNTRNNKNNSNINKIIKSMRKRLNISICFWIPLMYIAMHNMLYNMFNIPVPKLVNELFDGAQNALIFAFTQFLLVLPIIYINRNYFIDGFKRLVKKAPTMDSLVAIGSSASIVYGIYAVYMIAYGLGNNQMEIVEKFSADLYFESAGTILTLITFGKYLETKSKGKTTAAIEKLINLSPKTAIIEKDSNELEILTEEIKKDDIVIIKPGSSIPVDGVIIDGSSAIDQASITGESVPVEKTIGDTVVSGTINKNGYFKMKATKVGQDTTLAQIIRLVEEASNSKAPISKIADKVSAVFVPTVILIAIIATVFWILNGQSFEFALSIGISVLVISCPCALGLATPVAIMVGTGKGATQGILIKSAENLETLHSVDTVIFDKTGTITEGKPRVTDIIINSLGDNNELVENKYEHLVEETFVIEDKKEFLKIAASLEKSSEHPLGEAICEKAREQNLDIYEVKKFVSVPGRGVKGVINGKTYCGGNEAFMFENKIKDFDKANLNDLENNKFLENTQRLLNDGKTVLYFSENNKLIGIIAVADTIKSTSYDAIKALQKKKIDIVMLTGDNKTVATAIGKELGINKIIAEVLPQDKDKEVAKLQAEGKKVAFVGDGINDSPALVRADVGVAIGSGTDIAIESADIVLKNDNLLSVDTAIDLSKAVIRNIKMNLFWAFFYNCIGIPIAAGVFYLSYGLKLNPMIGAAAMSLSSVCVVTNALTLNFFKPKSNSKSNSKNNSKNNKTVNAIKNKTASNIKNDSINNLYNDSENEKNANEKQLVNELNKGEKVMNKFSKEISIDGMQCNHCKMTVEKALTVLEGVTKVEVNLENKKAILESAQEIENTKIKKVIEEAGFVIVEIK